MRVSVLFFTLGLCVLVREDAPRILSTPSSTATASVTILQAPRRLLTADSDFQTVVNPKTKSSAFVQWRRESTQEFSTEYGRVTARVTKTPEKVVTALFINRTMVDMRFCSATQDITTTTCEKENRAIDTSFNGPLQDIRNELEDTYLLYLIANRKRRGDLAPTASEFGKTILT